MSSFHFCVSAAKNLSLFQLLHTSLMTDLLQLLLGLPLFLLPWGFHNRAAFDISPSSFLNVWPIHLNFLFLISRFISSWSVTLHKSLLGIMFGHHILKMYLRHRLTKICILRLCYLGALICFQPYFPCFVTHFGWILTYSSKLGRSAILSFANTASVRATL